MNRRNFLRAIVAAPVALPAAVSAATAPVYASGGFVSRRPFGLLDASGHSLESLRANGAFIPTVHVDTTKMRETVKRSLEAIQKADTGIAMTGDECRCESCRDMPRSASANPIARSECCNKTVRMRCADCPLTQGMHPLQAITDAPPLAPDEAVADYIVDLSPARRRTVVAFTGLAGSGKSTAAAHLVSAHGFERVRFAGPLKAMMRELGLTEAEIEGDRKEVPCELLGGRTPRYAMQTIGTEWGRNIIASDLWIRAWGAAVAKLPAGKPVVVDDCRFPNEAEAVRALGGVLVRVERSGAALEAHKHVSEGQPLGETIAIRNDASLGEMAHRLDELLTSQVRVGESRAG